MRPHLHPSVSTFTRLFDCFECRVKRGNQVLHILRADGEADRVRLDALVQKLLVRQLAVGRGVGMDDQGLHICHIGQQGEDSQVVDELLGGAAVSLDLKGKDAAAPIGEILLIQGMV